MDKRYQVFVSSTYADLKEERRAVIQALMEMDCIPAGMELFPAADEEQFQFIKKVIDDCDYYILIIGGRYGSTTAEGLSYTEKEYDYAKRKGMKVLAFVHDRPDDIPLGKSEKDPSLRARLEKFRAKAKTNAIAKPWSDPKELPGLVALSLLATIKSHPAIGWVRADKVATIEALRNVNDLLKRNSELEATNRALSDQLLEQLPKVENIAGLSDTLDLSGIHQRQSNDVSTWKITKTWGDLFAAIGPEILGHPNDAKMSNIFRNSVKRFYQITIPDAYLYRNWELSEVHFQTAKIQFMALNLVDVSMQTTATRSSALFWSLTENGQKTLLRLRTQKRDSAEG